MPPPTETISPSLLSYALQYFSDKPKTRSGRKTSTTWNYGRFKTHLLNNNNGDLGVDKGVADSRIQAAWKKCLEHLSREGGQEQRKFAVMELKLIRGRETRNLRVRTWISGGNHTYTAPVINKKMDVHNSVHVHGDRNLNKLCVGGEVVAGAAAGSAGGHHGPLVAVPPKKGSPGLDHAELDTISEGEQSILLAPSDTSTSLATSAFLTAPSSPARPPSLEQRLTVLEEAFRSKALGKQEMDRSTSALTPRDRWLEQRVLSLENTVSMVVEELSLLRESLAYRT